MDWSDGTLRTDRLELRRPLESEHPFIVRWLEDPEVMRLQGGACTEDQRNSFLDFLEWHWERHGFGHFLGSLRSTGAPVGIFSLKYLQREADPATSLPDLGFFLGKEFWGQGLATEGAGALVQFGFGRGFPEIAAHNTPENEASKRVLVKLGFREAGTSEVTYHGRSFGRVAQWRLARTRK